MKRSVRDVLKDRAESLKTDIPAMFLAMKHPGTPWPAKALAALAVCYALSPIDLIPDFVPVIGYLDDLLILPGLVLLALRMIPADVIAECRRKAGELWQNGRPKGFRYAIPVILVWLVVILLTVKLIRG